MKIRTVFICILVLIAGLFVAACKAEKQREASKEEEAVSTYTFVDVYGQEYEAELLEDVPECPYDYSRLTEKNGYQYYTDESGDISSTLGIDVSRYQPEIDWQQVKASGIDFVMIRVGYRGYGEEGRLVEDECFRSHIGGALDAGLDVGVYFFSQAVNDEEAKEEARFVLERVKDYTLTYPVVFDTEEIKDAEARTDGLSKEQFTRNCKVFCDAIKEAGYDTMIYANMKWMAFTLDLSELAAYDFWYADYEPLPQCPYDFRMWQYTESGTVPGVGGNVDVNVWFDLE